MFSNSTSISGWRNSLRHIHNHLAAFQFQKNEISLQGTMWFKIYSHMHFLKTDYVNLISVSGWRLTTSENHAFIKQ